MIEIQTAFLPSLVGSIDNRLCIAIDALRSSASIITLLDRHCSGVSPALSYEHALILKQELTTRLSQEVVLCGEDRIGELSEGFDLHNSPSRLRESSYENSIVIMNSTSGTKMIRSLYEAPILLIACALNSQACADTAVRKAKSLGMNIAVVCSGSKENSQIAMEDILCAGLILSKIKNQVEVRLCDSSRIALGFYESQPDLRSVFQESDTGQRLQLVNQQEDVDYCSQIDITQTIPTKKMPLGGNQTSPLLFLRPLHCEGIR
jgi:2-phosphosulfolactate phosphatase